jgi:allantoin racemase
MTAGMLAVARGVLPGADVMGWTNTGGPAAIQGAEDGAAAVPGLLEMLPEARAARADALVIGCFDDTGLVELRARAHCPVIGIGRAAFHLAATGGPGFAVLTTLPVSVPVIEANLADAGLAGQCRGVFASGVPVLEVDAGAPETLERLAGDIRALEGQGASNIVLGCAGMSRHHRALAKGARVPLVDPVRASALAALALLGAV